MLKVGIGNTSTGTFAGTAIGTAVGESVGSQLNRSLAHVVIQPDGMVAVHDNESGSSTSMRVLLRQAAHPQRSQHGNAVWRQAIAARGMKNWQRVGQIEQLVVQPLQDVQPSRTPQAIAKFTTCAIKIDSYMANLK